MTLVSSALARAENRNINVRVVCTSLIFCEFFYAALKTHKKSNPAFLFCAILIFIDLTKKLVGGILKKEEIPDSVGRLHSVVNKAATVSRKGGFTF